MTLRARPLGRRRNRPTWENDHRRNLLLNIGFGLIVLLAVAILLGAAGATYYNDHLAPIVSVNGQDVSKDRYVDQIRYALWRIDQAGARVRDLTNAGTFTAVEGEQRLAFLEQQREQLQAGSVIDEMIEGLLQAQLARERGISITDAQIDEQIVKSATTPEFRHAWIISVKPFVSQEAFDPAQVQAAVEKAKAKADQALADVKAGKSFEDVAKTTSTDAYAEQGGDLRFISAEAPLDTDFVKALFALPLNGLTDVLKGADGTFRIGRVTQINPLTVDSTYQERLVSAGLSMTAHRETVGWEVARLGLEKMVLKEVVETPSLQRKVLQIFLADSPANPLTGDQVRVRHILYAPNDDPNAAASLKEDDPAWKKAEDEARAAHAALTGGATFASRVKETDDKNTLADGGDIGWNGRDGLDPAFAEAVFADGLTPDQIIGPVKSSFGWHVIQFVGRRKAPEPRANELLQEAKTLGADFAAIARANSDGEAAEKGGDIGWVARYQLDRVLEEAIFALNEGQVSGTVVIGADGYYIFKVTDVESRLPGGDQAAALRASAFANWFAARRAEAKISPEFPAGL